MKGPVKIVLLTRDTLSAAILYNYVNRQVPFCQVIIENPISNWEMFTKRVKRIGYIKALSQVIFIFCIYWPLRVLSRNRSKEIIRRYSLDTTPIGNRLVRRVSSVNAGDCRAVLQEIQPDLVLVNGTRIIGEKTIHCIQAPFINIHDGITPAFRGVHGGYWAMATGRPDLFGTTIHHVDKGIDTGSIISQVFTQPDKKDNFSTYPLLQHAVVLPEVVRVLKQFMEEGKLPSSEPVCENRPVRFHPAVSEWIRNIGRTWIFFFITGFITLSY